MKIFKWMALVLVITSCTTYPHSDGRESYIEKVNQYSAGDKQFSGIYDNFEFRSTLLTYDMVQAIHKRLNKYYAWSESDAEADLQQRLSEISQSTKIWLSFYTPDRKNDNLANKTSIWKIYLESGGQRYEGRAYKANKNFSEAKSMFHYHSKWATAYFVEFPVPTNQLGSNPKLIITGPLGRREVRFRSSSRDEFDDSL